MGVRLHPSGLECIGIHHLLLSNLTTGIHTVDDVCCVVSCRSRPAAGHCACARCYVCSTGELSAGELSFVDDQLTDDDVLLSLRYFHSADDFVMSYVYPSLWLLQPLFYENDSSTDWAFSDDWLPFLHVLQALHIYTGQINCTASYK